MKTTTKTMIAAVVFAGVLGGAPAFAQVPYQRIVTRQGREIRGIRVNEDAFTIQVRDAAGRFYSLRKSDLEVLDKQAGKTIMPSFASRLTAPELNDLVAYLVSLRGTEP